MPLILSKRAAAVKERMDAPDCDGELLYNTYVQFRTINILLSGWRLIYLHKRLIKRRKSLYTQFES